jgi:hypothetical protein
MPNEILSEQAQAQVASINELIKEAQKIARNTPTDELVFDPQGRLLIEVPGVLSENSGIPKRDPTPKTTVSLDINNIESMSDKFKEVLRTSLGEIKGMTDQKKTDCVRAYDNCKHKGSVIALQQEYAFHLNLALRTYQKALPDKFEDKEYELEAASKAAQVEVNKLVMAAFAKALAKATKNDVVNVDKLNQAMDKARKKILPEAHTILRKAIVRHTGQIITKEGMPKPKALKYLAEETTATPNDIIHVDNQLGLVTWIAGTDNTAHYRAGGKELADRQIIIHGCDENGLAIKTNNPRIQIRTPSIAVKVGLGDEENYIQDVVTKLEHLCETYKLEDRLEKDSNIVPQKAFIYNLHTALNHVVGDVGGNLQTRSARHIIQGAHSYNRKRAKDHGAYCLVQNISVNGFGDALGTGGDPLREEATLMAEMALLHTLRSAVANPKQTQKINSVFARYDGYLSNGTIEYFSTTDDGKQARSFIDGVKSAWRNLPPPLQPQSLVSDKVKIGLIKMMAHNLHYTNSGRLFQAMSVFAETASISGCKSGNERAQMINARAELFDALANAQAPLSVEGNRINQCLTNLAEANSRDVAKCARALETAVDQACDKLSSQSAMSIVSLSDQGAAAKVEAKPWYAGFMKYVYLNTNYAEASAAVMTNLHQSKAGAMQAHKGLTKHMLASLEGHPQTLWQRLQSRSGTAGALFWGGLMTITIIPLILVTYYISKDNKRRLSEVEAEDAELRQDHQHKLPVGESYRNLLGKKIAGSSSTPDSKLDIGEVFHPAASSPEQPPSPKQLTVPQSAVNDDKTYPSTGIK